MKETDLRGKTCVVPVAVVAGLGMAGMGLVSSGVVAADITSVTDTVNVTVQPSCTFNSAEDKTYAGSATNETEVNDFTESGVHEFNLFCNDNNGFTVTATPYDLEAAGIEDVIAYTDNYTHTGVDSMWTAAIASETVGVTVVNNPVPAGGGPIISSNSHTTASGATFTATYSAYVGTATPAGTYTGTIVYTLAASGVSNSGNGGSGSGGTNQGNGGGDSGDNSGNEVADNNGGGSGTDNSGSGDSGSGGSGSGDANSNDAGSNDTPGDSTNNTLNAAPLALNNTYNTYSTTNTYNTTNYSGGSGASAPVVANTQGATSGDESNGTTSSNENGIETNDSYEKPLGVTTSTSSSNGDLGTDLMPLVAAGAALAVAGVAVVALAQSKKEENQK